MTSPVGEARDIQVELAARTDVGLVREQNEDRFLLTRLSDGCHDPEALHHTILGDPGLLLLVCDGMGGAAAGEVAAHMATESVAQALVGNSCPGDADLVAIARTLRSAVEHANDEIFSASRQNLLQWGMGTTLTALLLQRTHAIVAQVGDSRAYLLRAGRLIPLTRDQSLLNKMLDEGTLTPEQVETFAYSNVIVQALGVQSCVDVQLSKVELRAGDRFLVCSDGLTGVCSDEELAALLGRQGDLAEVADALVELANAHGGPDNITVLVARLGNQGLPPATAGERLQYERWRIDPASASDLGR